MKKIDKNNKTHKLDHHFSKILVEWFNQEGRSLPWRQTDNPYHILVSEIMLQQTQVNTVIPYYFRFLEELPTLEKLSKASEEQLHRLWEGLGYYSRVFRLRQFAVEVLEKHNGVIPEQKEKLIALPGIGPYTCGAILSFAFHKPEPAIDGNVKRVLARLQNDKRDITKVETLRAMEAIVLKLMPKDPYAFNQGLIELGATYCQARNPKCSQCPLASFCQGYANGQVDLLPNKPKKKKQVRRSVPVFIIRQEQEVLFLMRKTSGLLSSLWGLPMIEEDIRGLDQIHTLDEVKKFIEDEKIQEYFKEEFGIELHPTFIEKMQAIKHVFSHIIWEMHIFIIEDQEFWDHVERIDSPETIKANICDISLPTAFKKCIAYISERGML